MIQMQEYSYTWRLVGIWLILAPSVQWLFADVSFVYCSHIRSSNLWGGHFWSTRIRAIFGALPRVIRISWIEVCLGRWFVEKSQNWMLGDSAYAFMYALIIISHFLFFKSLNNLFQVKLIDFHLHLSCPCFVQFIRKFHRTGTIRVSQDKQYEHERISLL